jgi:hypothetical protein
MSHIRIDLSAKLETLDGTPAPNTKGRILAASMGNISTGDALKFWHWSRELYKSGVLEVDAADFEVIKAHASSTENIPNWMKGQIIEALLATQAVNLKGGRAPTNMPPASNP